VGCRLQTNLAGKTAAEKKRLKFDNIYIVSKYSPKIIVELHWWC
jgi:hypothetical protein